ncbi:MAG: hypothetical protein NTV05_06925 [Acidobacteria bacterium]|nr:hypothetical protein [Acidobacteriota bacterium]
MSWSVFRETRDTIRGPVQRERSSPWLSDEHAPKVTSGKSVSLMHARGEHDSPVSGSTAVISAGTLTHLWTIWFV